jgi:hypothetical protein
MGAATSRPIVLSVGMLYPAYASFKALKSPSPNDNKQWLTYWVVFSITSSAEEVAEKVVAYVPGYYVLKCIFLVWLMLPKTRGAIYVYENFIVPMFQKYEPLIDAKMAEWKTIVDMWIADLKENGAMYVKRGLEMTLEKAKEVKEEAAKSPKKAARVVSKIHHATTETMRITGDSMRKLKKQYHDHAKDMNNDDEYGIRDATPVPVEE